ncbi:MAG: hypothetical protein IPK26_02350 [Planctomycetes bacterium]|nr:hypothetical protein [Planctomycetota bacterium]
MPRSLDVATFSRPSHGTEVRDEAIFGIPGGLEKKACERQLAESDAGSPWSGEFGWLVLPQGDEGELFELDREATLD